MKCSRCGLETSETRKVEALRARVAELEAKLADLDSPEVREGFARCLLGTFNDHMDTMYTDFSSVESAREALAGWSADAVLAVLRKRMGGE